MPLFEYRCDDCQRLNTLLVYSWSETNSPRCENCGSAAYPSVFQVRAPQVLVGSLNWSPSGETLRDVDESDPASMDRFMGRVKQEMDGQVTPDFEAMRPELSAKT